VIDISGPIYDGMWNYPEPLKRLLKDFKLSWVRFEFGGEQYSVTVFENMKAQTGTYLESPGRYLDDNPYTVDEIPIEKLFLIDTYVLFIPYEKLGIKDGKPFVSFHDIKNAEERPIPEGSAILIGTGYGRCWERTDFFTRSWFFKLDAMEYLIGKKPFLLGADSTEWENPHNPEGIFRLLFPANILILASCVNLEHIKRFNVKLTVLPLKVTGSYICPVRAIVTEH
jgi:kynurenine formamidase